MKRLLLAIVLAPIRLYQRFISPVLPRRCKYEPTCSAYAVQAIRELGVVRGIDPRRLAAGALQPVQPRRLRPGRGADAVSTEAGGARVILPLASFLQPLEDVANSVLTFFYDNVYASWGLAIIFLTIVTRLVILPLSLKQIRSMRSLQAHQPEIKRIQEKYKDDRQRMQREMMDFYRENKINPFASCVPLLLQLPVFFALFELLRSDEFSARARRIWKPRFPGRHARREGDRRRADHPDPALFRDHGRLDLDHGRLGGGQPAAVDVRAPGRLHARSSSASRPGW